MSKLTVKLQQEEIEEAVKHYVSERVTAGYRFEISRIVTNFDISEVDGSVSCSVDALVEEKEAS